MSVPPPYFEKIRQRASQRWDQLEADPELAAPWHQLFMQVQSPRHVVSELLQNADDAGATMARVNIHDDFFTFDHDGEDFIDEHFASLCRFGYSNKRALHTIGFRGIGFKSTFSIGNPVELLTPSLKVRFSRDRFTEPQWISDPHDTGGFTRIRVRIADINRRRELEKNLNDWFASPISFLFFKNIRRMTIGDRAVHWLKEKAGPIPGSHWMKLDGTDEKPMLLIRSDEEEFPKEALEEIRQERMIGLDQDTEFPPCRVEIVLGTSGRLYVVLPTGVETALPFACNAPFIQDPARLKIKDPDISPTNRWLLDRIGRLAADTMIHWLNDQNSTVPERACAYELMPDVDRKDGSLEGGCGAAVELAFAAAVDKHPVLLSQDGTVLEAKKCVIIPKALQGIWDPEATARYLDTEGRPGLSQHVTAASQKKLVNWEWAQRIDAKAVVGILREKHLPVPAEWVQLLKLWEFVAPELTKFYHHTHGPDPAPTVRIIPVEGKELLQPASEVVRLTDKRLHLLEEDWQFVSQHLPVMRSGWLQFLNSLADEAREKPQERPTTALATVKKILERVHLAEVSSPSDIVDRLSRCYFASSKSLQIADCVRVARIAAKLGAKVGESFFYVSRENKLSRVGGTLFDDPDGSLEELLPETERDKLLLHPLYRQNFGTCTEREWNEWSSSGKSGLLGFVPTKERIQYFARQDQAKAELQSRGWSGEIRFSYSGPSFRLHDWDFPENFRNHWIELAAEDELIWCRVLERILESPGLYHPENHSAVLHEVAKNGNVSRIPFTACKPTWAIRLSEQRCLPDTRGILRMPEELMRRTPQTEALMDIEPFIDARLDREGNRAVLDLIGVRSEPTGPAKIIDYLRALSTSKTPPIQEVEKWYRRLDQLYPACSTSDQTSTREAFHSERLILTEDGAWETAGAVSIRSGDDGIPDAAVVRVSVRDLSLWHKLDIAEHPSIERILEWLNHLPTGNRLDEKTAKRVRSLLARHPVRVWEACRRWINLDGEWVPVSDLCQAVTMQSRVPWQNLHPEHRRKTADLQFLPEEITGNSPFAELALLAHRIQERVQRGSDGNRRPVDWLRVLAEGLRRAVFDKDEDTQRLRQIGDRLFRTVWIDADSIEIMPYIDGTPAGTARKADVVWLEQELLVTRLPNGKLARLVPEEIGKAFNRREIRSALDYAFGRVAADVTAYLEENFKLAAPEEEGPDPEGDSPAAQGGDAGAPSPGEESESINENPAESPTPGPEKGSQEDPPSSEGGGDDNQGEPSQKPHRPNKPPTPKGPPLIQRYATSKGYKPDGDRFVHPNGHWLAKAAQSAFDWEKRSATGELLCSYWLREHCMEQDPLQLDAVIWNLLKEHPDRYALVLTNPAGNPVEWTGSHLSTLLASREITLHPATYRLVHADFHGA